MVEITGLTYIGSSLSGKDMCNTFFPTFFFFNVYLFLREREEEERERQNMSSGGAERERETKNLKKTPGSAVSPEPDAGLNLIDHEIMT